MIAHGGRGSGTVLPMTDVLAAARANAGDLPAPIEAVVALHAAAAPHRALAVLRSVAAARRAGADVEGRLAIDDQDVLVVRHHGVQVAISACAVQFPADGLGDAAAARNLADAVAAVMGGYEHGIMVRRPVPAGFDPSPVARAVHMWRLSMDRGEWQGRQAVYDDQKVALDIYVLRRPADGGRPRQVAAVPPLRSIPRLEVIYRAIAGAVDRLMDERVDLPVIVAVSASEPVGIGRGHLHGLLYGMPDEINVNDGRYLAAYRATGGSMFSEPTFRETSAVWWLHEGLAHDNPWCDASGAPAWPGRRFTAVVPAHGPARLATMGWEVA
jgi:hypothetical protein